MNNNQLIERLTRMGACAEAIRWIGGMSAAEALAALEPIPQHMEWSCWMADRVLPDKSRRHLRAALLRTMPEHLAAIPAVEGIIKALEADPFDFARLEEARQASMPAWMATEEWTAVEAARDAAAVAREASWAAGVDAEDVLRQQLAVVKDALNNHLKALEK